MNNLAPLIIAILYILSNLFSSRPSAPETVEHKPVISDRQRAEAEYRERLSTECAELFSRYPDEDGFVEEYFGTDIPFLADADCIDRGIREGFTAGTPQELASFCWYVNTCDVSGANLTITADIDLSELNWAPIGWSGGSMDTGHSFTGSVVGNNHTIKGLTMDTDGYYGGFIGWGVGAGVYDLAFTDASIKSRCTGAVCAAEAIGGTFSNVSVSGSVECGVNAGSLLGWDANARKVGCSAQVTVNGKSFPFLSYNDSEKARITVDESFEISIDSNHILRRTGGSEDYVNLCWNIYRDGEKFRYEGASGSSEYDCGFIYEWELEGEYTAWLTAFVEGQYVPVSNTISFTVGESISA